jgi:catechol 2,3-dioxygenase-like lactoylglutathione lyase family enzyme
MLSHVTLGASDIPRAIAFYDALLVPLGLARIETIEGFGAGWAAGAESTPQFWVLRPLDGGAPAPGNGHTLGFLAPDRASVDAFHASGLAAGGRCEGPPGLRPHYHPDTYGAYLRDPDGNKLCCVCHRPP